MISIKLFLFIYLLGGVTLIPLTLLFLYQIRDKLKYLLDNLIEKDNDDANQTYSDLLFEDKIEKDFKAGSFQESKGVEATKEGWISITKDYHYHLIDFLDLVKLNDSNIRVDLTNHSINEIEVSDRNNLKKKNKYFVQLKHSNLFLYKSDEKGSNLIHAINLKDSFVTIWPRDTSNEFLDGTLFTKRTCISIMKINDKLFDSKTGELILPSILPNQSNEIEGTNSSSTTDQFFLYFDNNCDKEDWYFTLINASKNDNFDKKFNPLLNPNQTAKTAYLNTPDTLYLIQNLNSTEGQLTTKWLNAFIGRLFLSLQQTNTLNDLLREKLYKKLTKINTPGFLDDFVIEEVDVGHAAPMIINPQLRELSPEGSTKIAFDMIYKGGLSLRIATKAQINLGSRFKQREISLKLALTLKELSGPMIIWIKPPPSNRFWYAFESDPTIDLDVEPVVSSNKLNYNLITNTIKGKLATAIKQSLVIPSYDDNVFYTTTDDIFRGGIWENYDNLRSDAKTFHSESHLSENIPPSDHVNKNVNTENTTPTIKVENISDQEDRKIGQHDNSSSHSHSHSTHSSFTKVFSSSQHFELPPDVDLDSDMNPNSNDNNSPLKQRTIQKVGSIRKAISSKRNTIIKQNENKDSDNSGIHTNEEDEMLMQNNDVTREASLQGSEQIHTVVSSETQTSLKKSKDDSSSLVTEDESNPPTRKYFKNSIRKFNKWVKDVKESRDNASDSYDELDIQESKIDPIDHPLDSKEPSVFNLPTSIPVQEGKGNVYKTGISESIIETPTMISNRRRPVPKIPEDMRPYSTDSRVSSAASQQYNQHIPTSTEMFLKNETSEYQTMPNEILSQQNNISHGLFSPNDYSSKTDDTVNNG